MNLTRPAYCSLCVALLLLASTDANRIRWNIEDGGNGHIYEIVSARPGGISWPDAQNEALNRGGHLATLTSAAENDFVYDNLVNDDTYWLFFNNAVYLGPWIGGFQPAGSAEPDGGWQWVNDEGLLAGNYDNWRNNEPNNFMGRVENSINFFNFSTTPFNGWNDFRGNVAGPSYIIEYAVPEPTGSLMAASGSLLMILGLSRMTRRSP